MSTIIYRTNKNGSTYAYESESFWSKEKKAPRTRRKYLGKVNPETGEIIRVYKKTEGDAEQTSPAEISDTLHAQDYEQLQTQLENLQAEVKELREQNLALKDKFQALKVFFDSLP